MSLSSSAFAGTEAAASGLAYDARSLDGLRNASAQDREAIRQVAQQFEALFMRQLLKGMRDAIPKSGMFEGPGADTFTSMLDTQLSTVAAGQGGGLAALIERQLLGDRGDGPRSAASVGAWSPASGQPFVPAGGTGRYSGDAGPGPLGQTGRMDGWEGQKGLDRLDRTEGPEGMNRPYGRTSLARDAQPYQVEGKMLADVRGMQASDGQRRESGQPAGGQGLARLGPVQAAFVQKMWPHAKAAEKSTGLPAAWVVGQAALESGWGQRDIRDAQGQPSHNLFGVKAGRGWKGKTVAAVTTEYVGGVAHRSVEVFRRYDSYAEAFADWAALMAASPRYRPVVEARSAREFAEGLEKGGYATDPAYGQKLKATIGSLVGAMTGQRQ